MRAPAGAAALSDRFAASQNALAQIEAQERAEIDRQHRLVELEEAREQEWEQQQQSRERGLLRRDPRMLRLNAIAEAARLAKAKLRGQGGEAKALRIGTGGVAKAWVAAHLWRGAYARNIMRGRVHVGRRKCDEHRG